MKGCILATSLVVLALIVPSSAIRCLECSGVSTDRECQEKGRIRECRFNQDACEIELREHEGWGGHVLMYKQCKQSRACDNNHVQNPRAAYVPSQCNPDNFNSVCRCCCYEDECNVARDTCFRSPGGCPTPPTHVGGGSISCSDGRNFGSRCTVTCNTGSMLVGVATTYCRYDGAWSFPFGQCQNFYCQEQLKVDNGWYSCTNGHFSGSQCDVQCFPGYALVGPKRRTCRFNQGWSPVYKTRCEPVQCPDRGVVVGGVVTCSNENYAQSRCRVECDGFRRLVGIYEGYCQDNGKWSHELPTCELVQCPIRGAIIHGSVDCSLGVDVNSQCLVTCDVGYQADGPVDSVCLPSGNWDNPLPRCIRIQCPPRGVVANGVVSCTDSVFVSSECTVICDDGTRLIGSEVSTCLSTGDWDTPLPVCEQVLCPELGSIENGVVSCTTKRFVGSVCTSQCNMGTQLEGSPTTVCLPSGDWSNPLPACPRIACPALDFSDQGSMVCTDDFFYASTCAFTCGTGLILVGSPRVRCQVTGSWSSRLPECRDIKCRLRGSVRNGRVSCSNANNLDSVCDVVCNEGYSPAGPVSSVCLNNGRWNAPLPTCRPIQCPFRGSLAGGSVSCSDGNDYGSVCLATCALGAELIGDTRSICLPSGEWDVPLPSCRSLPCSDQGDLTHGTKSCTNENNLQSVCTFTCTDPGYELYPGGRTRNICQPDQNWSLPKPCCTRPCPPYALMDLVLVLDSSSSIGDDNWVALTDFVAGILRLFAVAPDAANFAIFRYNRVVDESTEIFLNDYPSDITGLIEAFRKIPYDGSGTFTGNALNHALTSSLTAANGNRPGVKDVVFVITDGKAADDVKTPADELRANGAIVFVLGIEPPRGALDMDQLRDMAGSDENLVVATGGFGGLDAAFSALLSGIICGDPCS